MSTFKTTPTMWEFMNSDKYVRVIAGPVGSGKSVCCSHELVKMALQQAPNQDGIRKTRTLIVRNTVDQLRSTTMKTFFEWFPQGVWGEWRATERTFYMKHDLPDGTKVHAEFMFMPLDTPDDVRKALSLELTFLWGNEWRELHPEVCDGLLMRLRRYPSMKDGGPSRSCAIWDTNMPDMDTWHFDKMENPPHNWDVFIQPPAILSHAEYVSNYGEDPEYDALDEMVDTNGDYWYKNPDADNMDHLDPLYYVDMLPGKSEDFINVYMRCRYGRSLSGVPVYDKTFNPEFHISADTFIPLKSTEYPVVIGLDFGRTPAATFVQRTVRGQIVVLDELTSDNMGIETFIREKLKPKIAEKFLGCAIVVAPDPAGFAKQQIGEISPADVVKKAGYKVVRPVTNDPERRIQSVERLLLQQIDGKPLLAVTENCSNLLKGFKFGYRYKKNKQGMQDAKPDKNEFSHIHDSLQYACLVMEGNQIERVTLRHDRPPSEVRPSRNYVWT